MFTLLDRSKTLPENRHAPTQTTPNRYATRTIHANSTASTAFASIPRLLSALALHHSRSATVDAGIFLVDVAHRCRVNVFWMLGVVMSGVRCAVFLVSVGRMASGIAWTQSAMLSLVSRLFTHPESPLLILRFKAVDVSSPLPSAQPQIKDKIVVRSPTWPRLLA